MEGSDEMTSKTDDLASVVASLAATAQAQQAQIKALAVTAQAHQASLDAFDAKWKETGERIDNLTSVAASLVLSAQAHRASLEAFDAKWQALMDRFDAWLRGQGGNGRPS